MEFRQLELFQEPISEPHDISFKEIKKLLNPKSHSASLTFNEAGKLFGGWEKVWKLPPDKVKVIESAFTRHGPVVVRVMGKWYGRELKDILNAQK